MKCLNLLLLLLTLSAPKLFAQPPNDSIYWRIPLLLNDQPHVSTTEGCTVEWSCVDESLTGQCIEYHNDQWFSISPQSKGTTYLNLTVSRCKDIRGVQVVVFAGTPCETETYEPLVCYSMGTQGDIFIALDRLNPKQEYLVGIDGYLHDLCEFTIQWSEEPKGFPSEPERMNVGQVYPVGQYAELSWELPPSYGSEVVSFKVMRRGVREGKPKEIGVVPVKSYASGELVRNYTYFDSIPNNMPHEYTVWAIRMDDVPVQVMQRSVKAERDRTHWTLVLDYPDEETILYDLKDGLSDEYLKSGFFNQRQNGPRLISYDLSSYLSQGIKGFKVEVMNGEGTILDTYYYVYD